MLCFNWVTNMTALAQIIRNNSRSLSHITITFTNITTGAELIITTVKLCAKFDRNFPVWYCVKPSSIEWGLWTGQSHSPAQYAWTFRTARTCKHTAPSWWSGPLLNWWLVDEWRIGSGLRIASMRCTENWYSSLDGMHKSHQTKTHSDFWGTS